MHWNVHTRKLLSDCPLRSHLLTTKLVQAQKDTETMDSNTLGYVHDLKFRELVSKQDNELIKANVYSAIKLTKTVSEFCSKLAGIKEQTAANLMNLVETFRRKTNEIKKRPECQNKSFVDTWENIMTAVETEAKDLVELGQKLQKCVAGPLFNIANNKKSFCKKSFAYRESCQMQINKAEEELSKKHKDYSDAWYKFHTHEKETLKDHHIAVYHNGHNSFLLQLAVVNSMNENQSKYTVPDILDDVEDVHKDMNIAMQKYLKEFLGIQKATLNRLMETMEASVETARKMDVDSDINSFIKFANQSMPDRSVPFKQFFNPKATKEFKDPDNKQLTYLHKSLVVDQFTEPMLKRTVAYSRKRRDELEASIQRLTSQLDTSRSILEHESDSLNPRELSIDMNDFLQKRNDARDQSCTLKTLQAQMTLFTPEVLDMLGPIPEEYANDVGKSPTITIGRPNDTTTKVDMEKSHKFVEYNFLKPAQCSYCKGFIVGLVKQGLKCQKCRMNIHKKCKRNAPFCTGTPKSEGRKVISAPATDDSTSLDEDLYEEIDPEDINRHRERLSQPHIHNIASGAAVDGDDYEQPLDIRSSRLTHAPGAEDTQNAPGKQEVIFRCVALYDFDGEEASDLTVSAGNKIDVISQAGDEWWEGISNGRKGFFPSSFAEKIEENDVVLRILYDFDAESNSDEMQVEQGQIVVLVEDEGNGWTVGRSNGKKGAFPSSYAERL